MLQHNIKIATTNVPSMWIKAMSDRFFWQYCQVTECCKMSPLDPENTSNFSPSCKLADADTGDFAKCKL